ncbi:hypothetical protein LIER_29010 [Lithospermum erythrorhizon]|uniref:Uncharacterized protein n=1 Tax=Lithospermum erythrorhizon TaxID=34254 RepID=A0AAV3RHQ4_LITER
MTPDQLQICTQASQNHLISAGRPDGKILVHPLGSNGIPARMFEEEQNTRVESSLLGILLYLNKEKDKDIKEETDDVYDSNLVTAYDKYTSRFLEKECWEKAELSGQQLVHCKAFVGGGTSCSTTTSPTTDVIEELRLKYEEEEARNKALSEELALVNVCNAELQQETFGLKHHISGVELDSARNICDETIWRGGGVTKESLPSLACSLPYASSSTVIGLLV